jgi:hypothetical protein
MMGGGAFLPTIHEPYCEEVNDGFIETIFDPNDRVCDNLPYVTPCNCVVAHINECLPLWQDRGKSLPNDCTWEDIRGYNAHHCRHLPFCIPSQQDFDFPNDELNYITLRSMQSVGKLTEILEQDDPDWQHVDEAIHEHVQILHEKQELEGKAEHVDEVCDPSTLSQHWTKGGLLPLSYVRSIDDGTPDDDDLCLVVKTKVAGKVNNTALVDEGANRSVLNIDWYEHKGIDWRSLFKVPENTQGGIIMMANQTPVETHGKVHVPMELLDAKGKKFVHEFYLMRLGKYNYAHILGCDWKKRFHSVTFLPEYVIHLRKLGCKVSAYPKPVKTYPIPIVNLYNITDHSPEIIPKPCEEVSPQQLAKDIKVLSARLRRIHVYVPPMAFVRQIIVRPATKEDEMDHITNLNPPKWQVDDDLESRAAILRQKIEDTYRKEYSDVLDCEPKGLNTRMPHEHIVEVPEGVAPYNQKLRRLSPMEMQLLSDYIKEMVEGGRIRPSTSPWGANVLFVPKPCGGFRCCQDYRELNKKMRHDTYPLPRIDVHMDMAQGTFWSKMDLLKGFYQLPMHKDSVKYTAFNTLLGKYEFLVMPMGLQNAPGSFMRAMNKVFEGLLWDPNLRQECGVLVYLDDILVFSQTEEQHMDILKKVFDRLRQYGLQCRFDKCTFAATEVTYLGFKLSHQGVRMDPKKVEIIKNWSDQPKNKSDIRAFLGLINYLKRFCKGLSNHTALLSSWSSESSKEAWTDKHKQAMQAVKDLLCSEEVLASPKIDPQTGNYYPFTVITDASELAVGAILLQQQGPNKSDTKVIGYSSSKFKHAERNYSVHEKELLGVLLAVQQWNCFLEGSKFTVYTDHSSLVWLNKLKEPSRRQSRWVDILQGHDFEVLYVKGEHNPADAFTRVPWLDQVVDEEEQPIREPLVVLRTMREALACANVHIKVTPSKLDEWKLVTQRVLSQPFKMPSLYKCIVEAYNQDPDYSNVEWINKHGLVFKDGLFYRGSQIAIPNVLAIKRDILIQHHDSMLGGHLGIHKTVEKVTRLFWWPCITTEVENHVKTCPACQVSKYRNWKPQGQTFDVPIATSPWEVVHVDFAGPFKHVAPGGYNRIVIFTDSFTKLSVFVKCRTTITSAILADLYIEHIWKVYGRPGQLVSDNEPILCAEAWVQVHEKLGTKLTHIAAYNAKANGAAEVMVKQLKSMLRAYEVQGLKWWKVLAACERGYNDSIHSATGFTPFYMNFGRHPHIDSNSFLSSIEQQFVHEFVHNTQAELARVHQIAATKMHAKKIRDTAKRNASRTATHAYQIGDYVYLETSAFKKSHALAPLRAGPFAVKQVVANGNAVYLEGFRHPFNVEMLTPTLCFRNRVNTHLTQHVLDLPASTHTLGVCPIPDQEVQGITNLECVSANGESAGTITGAVASTSRATTGTITGALTGANAGTITQNFAGTGNLQQGRESRQNRNELQQCTSNQIQRCSTSSGSTDPLGNSNGVFTGESHNGSSTLQGALDEEEDWGAEPFVRITPTSQPSTGNSATIRAAPHLDSEVLGILAQPQKLATFVDPSTTNITSENGNIEAANQPLQQGNNSCATDQILEVGSHIILPSQLPGNFEEILEKIGTTRSTTKFICLLSDGTHCSIGQSKLRDLVGKVEYDRLLHAFMQSNLFK